MMYRPLGTTGLQVSALGFGCGDVGGIIVRGSVQERLDAVARALDAGVTYFDTASMYGRGQSEINLGAALRQLRATPVVGTKVRLQPGDLSGIAAAIAASVDGSLARLGMDRVDLVQLHNQLQPEGAGREGAMSPAQALEAATAFEGLRRAGKVGAWGFTGLGDTAAVHAVIDSGLFHTVQTSYNLLNPSSGGAVPPGYPYQDYGALAERAAARGMGVIAIRTLAAGALSGSADRHTLAAQAPAPIGTGADLAEDAAAAAHFRFLWDEGYAANAVEAALRFAMTSPAASTALVGLSSMEQLETALAAAEQGPLPGDALERLPAVWAALAGA